MQEFFNLIVNGGSIKKSLIDFRLCKKIKKLTQSWKITITILNCLNPIKKDSELFMV